MSLRQKTLEELEDLEQELFDQEAEHGSPNYSMKIHLYEEMYRRLEQLVRQKKDEYSGTFAPYRLGFLSYKHQKYSKAIQYFQTALENQKYSQHKQYQLNSQQEVNAHLYLTNSALHIAN